MTSFYPGPSRVHDKIPKYVRAAHKKGILSMNHRSPEFIELSKRTIALLKDRLAIPKEYTVFYTSSGTECWEIIAQSVIEKNSLHVFNGAFGEKWFDYTKRLRPEAESLPFDLNELPGLDNPLLTVPEIICLTQNETSNGTQLPVSFIALLKKNNPKAIIAVDATSSMAGINLNFKAADIWFASVQKCFGLPAGLALLICSPKALDSVKKINERLHYNSLTFMNKMMADGQTTHTPNVLGIYLLNRVLKKMKAIAKIDQKITGRHREWLAFFKDSGKLRLPVSNPEVLSKTVITIKGRPEWVEKIKTKAKSKGLLLGEGYGSLKKETFRIANFPALRKKEIRRLMNFLLPYL
jgi:phosphoserine aminotransferase